MGVILTFAVFCQLLFAQCNQLHILTEDVVYANQLAEEMGENILMIIWSLYRIGLLLLQRSIYDTVRQENPLGMWVTRALHWPRRAASVNLWRRFQCLMIGAPPLSITCRRAADATLVFLIIFCIFPSLHDVAVNAVQLPHMLPLLVNWMTSWEIPRRHVTDMALSDTRDMALSVIR